MRRLVLLALVAPLAGCGAAADRPAAAHRLAAWRLPARMLAVRVPPIPAAAPVVARARPRARPPAPAASAGPDVSSGAPSDAEVRRELAQLYGGAAVDRGDGLVRAVMLTDGLAEAPPDAPAAVAAIVAAANRVAKLPYVYGGGHGRDRGEGIWVDSAYDCSGSVSFALASAGLLRTPYDSTSFMRYGRPGPGRWVTIYANAGHAFMTVGGARFDTSGLRGAGSRWQPAGRHASGFAVRHPPGL